MAMRKRKVFKQHTQITRAAKFISLSQGETLTYAGVVKGTGDKCAGGVSYLVKYLYHTTPHIQVAEKAGNRIFFRYVGPALSDRELFELQRDYNDYKDTLLSLPSVDELRLSGQLPTNRTYKLTFHKPCETNRMPKTKHPIFDIDIVEAPKPAELTAAAIASINAVQKATNGNKFDDLASAAAALKKAGVGGTLSLETRSGTLTINL